MSSIRRLGLAAASVATAAAVAGVFVAQGYISAQQAVAQSAPSAAVATPTTTPETVYVRPAPSQQVINVTQTAPPAAQPPVIHVIVPSAGGENEVDDD